MHFNNKYSLLNSHMYHPEPRQTYITYYHNWLRMAVIGIIPFSAICCLNLRIFLAVR